MASWSIKPKFLFVLPLLLLMLTAVACGGDKATPQPTPTPIDVAGIVQQVISAQPAGATSADVASEIAKALAALPGGVTSQEMAAAIANALAAQPGVTTQDVAAEIAKALAAQPGGVTSQDMAGAIANALAAQPGVTTQDVAAEIAKALAAQPGVTTQEMAAEIAKALAAQPGVTEEQVAIAVENALKAQPGVSQEDIAKAVESAVAKALPTAMPVPTSTPGPGMEPKFGGTVPMLAIIAPIGSRVWPEISYVNLQWMAHLYNNLIEYNPETSDPSDLRCDLCADWKLADDGLTYTFDLPKNARWTDGTPVTAEDVVFSMDSFVDPENPAFGDLWEDHTLRSRTGQLKVYYDFGNSRAIDEHTVEIKTKFKAAAFLPTLALEGMKIMAKHVVWDQRKHQGMAEPNNMVGSGPFVYVKGSFIRDTSLEHRRNPAYFKEGYPRIDGIKIFQISDTGTIIGAYITEQILMGVANGDNIGSVESRKFEEDYGDRYDVYFIGPAGAYHVMFNSEKAPFDDPRVRRAINLAVHRQEAMELFGAGDMLGTPFPPGLWYGPTFEEAAQMPGFRESSPGVKDQRDIDEAKRLLAEAGFPDGQGFNVKLMARGTGLTVDISAVVAEQLNKFLNINVEQDIQESSAGAAKFLAGDFQFAIQPSGMSFLDPDGAFSDRYAEGGLQADKWARGSATTNWDRVQEIFLAQSREIDQDKRRVLIREASALLMEDNWLPTLWWVTSTMAFHKKIRNEHPNPSPAASSWKQEHIWCDPAC
jgi:peptide/nickel transport system substrate-binding protein